jgi:hypothetical protein
MIPINRFKNRNAKQGSSFEVRPHLGRPSIARAALTRSAVVVVCAMALSMQSSPTWASGGMSTMPAVTALSVPPGPVFPGKGQLKACLDVCRNQTLSRPLVCWYFLGETDENPGGCMNYTNTQYDHCSIACHEQFPSK